MKQKSIKRLMYTLPLNEQNAHVLLTCVHKYIPAERVSAALYDIEHLLRTCKHKRTTLEQLIRDIRTYGEHFIWYQREFLDMQNKLDEENYFRTSPIDLEEGALECKCGSKRTISYQRQTRSADEGFTTFARCVECGNRWRHNN